MSDFFLPVILSARCDTPVIGTVQQILIKAQQVLTWLPNLTGESVSLFYASPAQFPRLNPTPEGLTDTQQKQWTLVYQAMQPVTSAVMHGEMQAAKIEGDKIASNTALWDAVYRVDLAVATVGLSEVEPIVKEKWKEMQGRIREWDDVRSWALKIAAHKDCPPDKAAEIRRKIDELDGSISGKITSLAAQIPGMRDALKQEGLGAIAALASLATIKTAVLIAAIIAVVAVIVYCISSVKTVISDLGLSALGDAVKAGQKALGPWLGVAIFGLIGFVIYRKVTQPKTILRLR
jgi:hypothetical protein